MADYINVVPQHYEDEAWKQVLPLASATIAEQQYYLGFLSNKEFGLRDKTNNKTRCSLKLTDTGSVEMNVPVIDAETDTRAATVGYVDGIATKAGLTPTEGYGINVNSSSGKYTIAAEQRIDLIWEDSYDYLSGEGPTFKNDEGNSTAPITGGYIQLPDNDYDLLILEVQVSDSRKYLTSYVIPYNDLYKMTYYDYQDGTLWPMSRYCYWGLRRNCVKHATQSFNGKTAASAYSMWYYTSDFIPDDTNIATARKGTSTDTALSKKYLYFSAPWAGEVENNLWENTHNYWMIPRKIYGVKLVENEILQYNKYFDFYGDEAGTIPKDLDNFTGDCFYIKPNTDIQNEEFGILIKGTGIKSTTNTTWDDAYTNRHISEATLVCMDKTYLTDGVGSKPIIIYVKDYTTLNINKYEITINRIS